MRYWILVLLSLLPLGVGAQERWSVDRCMAYAVEHGFLVGRAEHSRATARQEYTAAIGRHLPHLSASVGASANFGRGIDPATNTYVNTTTFNNGYGVALSLPIFDGLNLLNNTLRAKVDAARATSEVQKVRDDLALEVMSLYTNVLYTYGLVELTTKRVATFSRELNRVRRQSELGIKSAAEVAQLAATLAKEELSLITRGNDYDRAVLALKEQMNFPLADSLVVDTATPLSVVEDSLPSAEVLFAEAGQYLPAMVVLEQTIQAQRYALQSAKSAYYPSLSASAGLSTNYFTALGALSSSARPFGTQLEGNMGQYASLSLSIPIFNGMSARTSIAKAKITYRQAQSDYTEQMRALDTEIRGAVMDLEAARAQVVGSERAVTAATLALKAAQGKWEQGVIDAVELLTVTNQLLEAQVEQLLANLRYGAFRRQVDYYAGLSIIR